MLVHQKTLCQSQIAVVLMIITLKSWRNVVQHGPDLIWLMIHLQLLSPKMIWNLQVNERLKQYQTPSLSNERL